jgi:hypothetical protein
MTKEQLDELERLEAEARTAPWNEDWCYGAVRHIHRNVDTTAFYSGEDEDAHGWGRYDGVFIAKMRNAFPSLLALARDGLKCQELEAENRKLKEVAQNDYAEGWSEGAESVMDKLHRAHKLIDAIRVRVGSFGEMFERLEEIKRLIADYEAEQAESLKVLEGE